MYPIRSNKNHHAFALAIVLALSGAAEILFHGSIIKNAYAQSSPGEIINLHMNERMWNPVYSATIEVADGCRNVNTPCDWNEGTTWTTGQRPTSNSKVQLNGNVRIYNRNAVAESIGIYPGGTLSFSQNNNTKLAVDNILVFEGGTFEIGTDGSHINSAYTAEVSFSGSRDYSQDIDSHLHGLIAVGGTVSVHGRTVSEPFIRTNVEPTRNDNTVVLQRSALAAGWRNDDVIAIPTSRQCRDARNTGCSDETEDHVIESISSNGLLLTLKSSLAHDHPGARNHEGELEFMPHVVNKSRNVIFKSANPNGRRAHMLFHGRADVRIQYAAVQDMGRTNIDILSASNQKGRYPIHAHHLIGPVGLPQNVPQFLFEGNVVDFGEENELPGQRRKWGIAIHGSHYGVIEANVVDQSAGAGIVTESGSESGNSFLGNFVLRVVSGLGDTTDANLIEKSREVDTDPGDGSKLGRAGVAYWFNGGGLNRFEGNVAAAVYECIYCYGFKFDNKRNGELMFPRNKGDNPHMASQRVTRAAETIGLNNVIGNEAYAVPNGLTVWWECTFGEFYVDNCSSRIEDFSVWHHHRWGIFNYPSNNMTLVNFVIRGDVNALSNKDENVAGLEFDDYMQRRLTIINADIQNVHHGIQMSSLRDKTTEGSPLSGFNRIEDSYIVATHGINIWPQSSQNTNGVDLETGIHKRETLPEQTTIIRNTRFDLPALNDPRSVQAHIYVEDTPTLGIGNENKTNFNIRNDVWIYNYNAQSGTNLYLTTDRADYGASACDNTLANCGALFNDASYPYIARANIYPLRGGLSSRAPQSFFDAPAESPPSIPTPGPSSPQNPNPDPDPQPDPDPRPEPEPDAPNLVQNSTFNSTISPWYFQPNDGSVQVFHTNLYGGELRMLHYDNGEKQVLGNLVLDGSNMLVSGGETYRATFTAFSNFDDEDFEVYLVRQGSLARVSNVESFKANSLNSPRTYEVDFTVNGSIANQPAAVAFNIGGGTETLWIDNVSIVSLNGSTPPTQPDPEPDPEPEPEPEPEPPVNPVPGNLIANGTFDINMAGWGGWSSNDSMTIARNAGQLSVSHTQQTGEISNVGYNFEGGVVAGEQHRLRFKLSSIENGSPVTVYLRQQTTPRQPLTEKVLLTANVAQQSFDLTFDVLQSHAGGTRLLFVIDDRTEAVSIDDVSLVKVSAEQLIVNGNFNNGLEPWYFGSPDNSLQVFGSSGGIRMLHYNNSASALPQLYHDIGSVIAGEALQLSFGVKSNGDNRKFTTYIQRTDQPLSSLSNVQEVTANFNNDNYASVELPITINQNHNSARLVFQLDPGTETIWLDNVSLIRFGSNQNPSNPTVPVSPPIIQNGSFNDVLDYWSTHSNGGTLQAQWQNGSVTLTHAEIGNNAVAQLFQNIQDRPLVAGEELQFEFNIRSVAGTKPVIVYLQDSQNYSVVSNVEEFYAATAASTQQTQLTITKPSAAAQLIIQLDDRTPELVVDDVKLY